MLNAYLWCGAAASGISYRMETKQLIAAIIALATVWFAATLLLSPENGSAPPDVPAVAPPDAIGAIHAFRDGMHTLSGTIALPTPCYKLKHETVTLESFPEQVRVAFTVERVADYCAQVIVEAPFLITVRASKDARFFATFNGRPVNFLIKEKTDLPIKHPAEQISG